VRLSARLSSLTGVQMECATALVPLLTRGSDPVTRHLGIPHPPATQIREEQLSASEPTARTLTVGSDAYCRL
jgi:hypothetical protein